MKESRVVEIVLLVVVVIQAAALAVLGTLVRQQARPSNGGQTVVPKHAARVDELLVPPPMVGEYTLRDWLIHYTNRDRVWEEVVAEFYNRAAAVPVIADYFRNTDMERQRLHFCRALTLVTHNGMTAGLLRRLGEIHETRARSSAGEPISGEIYDAVIATLVKILQERGVPQGGVEALAATIAPVREVIVRR